MTGRRVLDGKQSVGHPHVRLRSGKKVAALLAGLAAVCVFSAGGSVEQLLDFGVADTSAANTFWSTAGYSGGSVCRAASAVIDGFDSRICTWSATRKFRECLKAGFVVILF